MFRKIEMESGGGQDFLKMKDGDTIKVVFRGQPIEFSKHWLGDKSSVCTGIGCEACKAGNRPGFKFRVNVLIKEGDAYVAKIFEQGITVWNQMADLAEDYDIPNTVMKISRKGSGAKDTTYTVLPLPAPNGVVTPEMNKKFAAIPLHDLVALTPGAGAQPQQTVNAPADEIPF